MTEIRALDRAVSTAAPKGDATRTRLRIAMVACVIGIAVSACGAAVRPFVLKPLAPPSAKHCFDSVGHMSGATPFILGGTCACTPTEDLMMQYHAAGAVLDMQLEDLLRVYEERGIHFESREHSECNNLCKWGPHLVKGGRCMVSPTPATRNFEDIRYGQQYLRSKE